MNEFRSSFWRIRADETRALSEELGEVQWLAQSLQRIADQYDEIAARTRVGEGRDRQVAEVVHLKK